MNTLLPMMNLGPRSSVVPRMDHCESASFSEDAHLSFCCSRSQARPAAVFFLATALVRTMVVRVRRAGESGSVRRESRSAEVLRVESRFSRLKPLSVDFKPVRRTVRYNAHGYTQLWTYESDAAPTGNTRKSF